MESVWVLTHTYTATNDNENGSDEMEPTVCVVVLETKEYAEAQAKHLVNMIVTEYADCTEEGEDVPVAERREFPGTITYTIRASHEITFVTIREKAVTKFA